MLSQLNKWAGLRHETQPVFYLPGLAQYGNEWQYFATDRLGSTRQLVDPVGEVLRSQTFDPFGNVLEQAGTAQSAFGYTGEQTDPTGLVFLRARYYDPRMGRFLTEDSIVPEPLKSRGWNRYAYLGNNPVASTDPSGHCGPLQMAGVVDGVRDSIDIVCNGGGAAGRGSFSSGGLVSRGLKGSASGAAATALAYAVREGINQVIEGVPLGVPDEYQQTTTSPTGSCSVDTGYHPGPNITPKPYDFPPFDLPQPPSIDDVFHLDNPQPVEWPNTLEARWRKMKNEYGEYIRVRKLSNREVRELGLHEEKQRQGFKGRDAIYEDEYGETWIRGRWGGPLIQFP